MYSERTYTCMRRTCKRHTETLQSAGGFEFWCWLKKLPNMLPGDSSGVKIKTFASATHIYMQTKWLMININKVHWWLLLQKNESEKYAYSLPSSPVESHFSTHQVLILKHWISNVTRTLKTAFIKSPIKSDKRNEKKCLLTFPKQDLKNLFPLGALSVMFVSNH